MMKNGKLFGIINIIDLLVIIVLLAAAIGIGFRLLGSRAEEISNMVGFEYVVRVDGVREQTVKALEKKGKAFAEKNNIETGEIVNVSVQPYKQDAITVRGERKTAEMPERYTVYVTVRADGTFSDGTYYDNDKTQLGVGRGHKICTHAVATNGEIVSINAVD